MRVIVALSLLMAPMVTLPENSFAADKPFTFGLLLVGPHNDRGSSQAHYQGGQFVIEAIPETKMIYIDRVNPTDRPGVTITQLVDDMVDKGARLIIATSIDMQNGIHEAALTHPDIYFLQISGDDIMTGKGLKNLSNFSGRMEFAKMMAGFAAAMTTRTGKIGYMGSLSNEETRRLASSCYLGARYAWQNILKKDPQELKFQVTWIGYWFNIPDVTMNPTQVLNNYFNTEYDVVISGIASSEITLVAKQAAQAEKPIWVLPYDDVGACKGAFKVCLGVPFYNWGPGYLKFVRAAMSGGWEPEWIWLGPDWKDINNPHTTAVGFVAGPALSDAAVAELDAFIKRLGTGNLDLFKGPLSYLDGKQFVSAGQTASDKQVWYMEQLLLGMDVVGTPK
jgi:simple sugar transport system substrate-binding protein